MVLRASAGAAPRADRGDAWVDVRLDGLFDLCARDRAPEDVLRVRRRDGRAAGHVDAGERGGRRARVRCDRGQDRTGEGAQHHGGDFLAVFIGRGDVAERGAAGGVLVAETVPPELRNKATSLMQSTWALGALLAVLLSGLVLGVLPLGDNAWRVLFAIGVLPALLILWVQRGVQEPELWHRARAAGEHKGNPYRVLFGPTLWRRTLLACVMASCLQFAYWGLFFWLPNLLAAPLDKGGAGMSIVKSTGWLVPIQIGAFVGYLSFGPLADKFGRRRVFALILTAAALG